MGCKNCKAFEKECEALMNAGFTEAAEELNKVYEELNKHRDRVRELEDRNAELEDENEKLKDWIRSGKG